MISSTDDPPNHIENLTDTEGLAWGLYYHLWKKTHKGEACPNINIPHTVVYQDSAPIAWYFTSSKDGKIYRKKRSNVTGAAVCEAFQHKHPEVDACAWFSGTMTFLSASPKKKRAGSSANPGETLYELEPEEETKEPARFDWWSRERLQRLVAPGQYTAITESIYDGVLQKFVMPREAYDHVIRAIWSPTACVCERRCSNFPLSDERQALGDRMASFDSNAFWLSTHQPLPASSVLVQRLTTACESIVRHLAETSGGRISVARMQLYFKIDTHNRIWLTLCNSLRLDRTVVSVTRSLGAARAYSIKDAKRHDEDTRIPDDPADFMCVVTGETCPGSERCDVSYKILIADWFKQVSDLAEESDRMQALDNIPPAIRRANPNITREYYLRMRAQPAFLLKTAPVCRSAAGALTTAALADLSRTIARPRSALAESAVVRQLALSSTQAGGGAADDPAAAAAAAQKLRSLAASGALPAGNGGALSGGGLKLVAAKGPPPPPPSDPNILYEPGAQIPAALIPKSVLASALSDPLHAATGGGGSSGAQQQAARGRGHHNTSSWAFQQQLQQHAAAALSGRLAPPGATLVPVVRLGGGGGAASPTQHAPSPGGKTSGPSQPPLSSSQRQRSPQPHPRASAASSSPKRTTLPHVSGARRGGPPPAPATAQGEDGAVLMASPTRQAIPSHASKAGAQPKAAPKLKVPAPSKPAAAASPAVAGEAYVGPDAANKHLGGGKQRPTSATRGASPAPPAGAKPGSGSSSAAAVAALAAAGGGGVSGNGADSPSAAMRASHMSSEDLKTLKELSDAYASAEAKTKQLLAEAQDILKDTGGSLVPEQQQAEAQQRPASGGSASGLPPLAPAPPVAKSSSMQRGSRPASARPGSRAGSARTSAAQGGAGVAAALQPKEGGVGVAAAGGGDAAAAAGLTADEAALLSDALKQSHEGLPAA